MLPDFRNITLVLAPADELLRTNLGILKHFLSRFSACLYISVNFDAERLLQTLRANHLDPSCFTILDCVGRGPRGPRTVPIPSPSALTELGIAVSQAIESLPKDSFLIVDALSTLVIYNPADHVARFARFLTTQAKAAGIPAVLLAADKEMDETLYAKVAQFCDQTLKPAPRTTRRARGR